MPVLLAMAGGKGGVGKSVIAANLACELSRQRKKTILVDLDLGAANLHTILGLKGNPLSLGNFVYDKEEHLQSLLINLPAEQGGFFFIAGDGLVPGTANLSFIRKQRLIKELKSLDADYIILDLGAGTNFNTIDFFLAANHGFLVSTPEPTSILNAYSFIKTAVFRLLSGSFPAKSTSRTLVIDFFCSKQKNDQAQISGLHGLLKTLSQEDGAAVPVTKAGKLFTAATARIAAFKPHIVMNLGQDVEELSQATKLRNNSRKYLGTDISYIACVPYDPAVRKSVMNKQLLCLTQPASTPFSKAIALLTEKICDPTFSNSKAALENFEDLQSIAEEVGSL